MRRTCKYFIICDTVSACVFIYQKRWTNDRSMNGIYRYKIHIPHLQHDALLTFVVRWLKLLTFAYPIMEHGIATDVRYQTSVLSIKLRWRSQIIRFCVGQVEISKKKPILIMYLHHIDVAFWAKSPNKQDTWNTTPLRGTARIILANDCINIENKQK